jgi:hypothetical protein
VIASPCSKVISNPQKGKGFKKAHGPYYYAYWKDPESKKLKKKYIGDHMP